MRSSGRSRSARRAISPIEGSLSSFHVLRNGTMTASGGPAICTFLMPASGDPCVPGTVRYRQSGWRETNPSGGRSGVPCVFAACTAARNLRSSMAKARAVSPSVKADRIPIFLSLSIALSVCSQCLQNPPAAAPAAGGSSWNSRTQSAWHEFLRSFTLHFSQHLPKSPAPFRDRLLSIHSYRCRQQDLQGIPITAPRCHLCASGYRSNPVFPLSSMRFEHLLAARLVISPAINRQLSRLPDAAPDEVHPIFKRVGEYHCGVCDEKVNFTERQIGIWQEIRCALDPAAKTE